VPAPIRVLIVDDSSVVRMLLREVLESADGFEVVGEACDGREAVEMVQALRPGLVTMDLEMPIMDGLTAIAAIMSGHAVPILVVSAASDAQRAFRAISLGALEVVCKQTLSDSGYAPFLDKARLVASIPVITHVRTALFSAHPTAPVPAVPPVPACSKRVVAIASSTGGPQALAAILAALPASFPYPIVIAQHIVPGFAQGLADWLGSVSPLPVRLGVDGEALRPGTVTLAPPETNMCIEAPGTVRLLAQPERQIYHPSCDKLLASVAEARGGDAVGVILTGMGSDGAAGMAAIHRAGGFTFGQNEATSVIFGMNAVAIGQGVVRSVLALDDIAAALADLDNRPGHWGGAVG
jgi:two-component system chemotaxis response regulator CheB